MLLPLPWKALCKTSVYIKMLLVNLERSYHFSVLEINLMITGRFLTNVTELDVIEFNAKGVVFSKLSIFLDKKLKIVNKGAFKNLPKIYDGNF